MDSKKLKRRVLIALHLAVPALILALIIIAGESAPRGGAWRVLKDSRWRKLEAGLELRELQLSWRRAEGADGSEAVLLNLKLTAVRLDLKRFKMEAAANPVRGGESLADLARDKKAAAVSNGGYFGHRDEPVTLLISRGKVLREASGSLPLSGVFTLDREGRAKVRALKDLKPPYEGIDFAVQNSPLLVREGAVQFREKKPVGRRHRRTALGVDAAGRAVLAVCDAGAGLGELAEVLSAPEALGGFGLRSAVNLDGGPSSGLAVNHEKARRHVPAGRTVPYVILVTRRAKPLVEKKPPKEPAREKPVGRLVPVRPGGGAGE